MLMTILKELQNEFRGARPESKAKDLLVLFGKAGNVIDITWQDDGKQVHIQYRHTPEFTDITPLLYRDYDLIMLGQLCDANRVWFCTADYMKVKHIHG